MKSSKQILILALALAFVLSFVPAKASASNAVAEGTIGQLSWWLDEEGVLRFSGDGEIPDFSSSSDAPWYDHKDEIKEVILEGVTSIGNNAFYKYGKLTKVSMSYTVTQIGSNAFARTSLTEIILPSGVTTIDDYAFQGCSGVLNLVLPSGLTTVGRDAFSGLWQITKLEIPSSVTNIGYNAFSGLTSITSLHIPKSVKNMGGFAFARCSKLSSVTFEGDAPTIENYVFDSTALTASYPCNAKGWDAAIDCTWGGSVTWKVAHNLVGDTCTACGMISGKCGDNLTWVLSADGVLTISGSGAMGDYNNAAYDDTYNTNPFPWYDHKDQIKEVIIEEGVTSIDGSAFNNYDNIVKVSLPSTLTAIGDDAFSSVNNLTTVSIANGLAVIGNRMFADCYQLSSVNIPVSLKTIGTKAFYNTALEGSLELSGVTTIGEMAFMSCTKLTNVVLGDSLKTIADRAFEGCTGLTELVIPDSVETIGLGALSGCSSLQKLTVPFVGISKDAAASTLTHHIGYIFGEGGSGSYAAEAAYAKSNGTLTTKTYYIPSSLTELTVTGGELQQYALRGFKTLKKLSLDGLYNIGAYALMNCSGLQELHFNGEAPFIVDTAFSDRTFDAYYPCNDDSWDSIITSTYGGTVTWKAAHNFVNGTCENCKASEVTIIASGTCGEFGKNNLTWTLYSDGKLILSGTGGMDIGPDFDDYKSAIKTVVIEDGVTAVGALAFNSCSNLTSVTIPDSVTSIGGFAFNGCSSLETVSIGNKVISIGTYAFSGCSNLTSVTIPDSVTSIGDQAYKDCSALASLTIGSKVESIGSQAFQGCSNLTSVTISDSVTSIGGGAFKDCSGLSSLTIGNKVESIGSGAFFNCKSLTSVTIPDSVTSVGDRAFYGCSSLESVSIGNGVASIGESAFDGCSNLVSVIIGNSVTSIGNKAFYNCKSMTTVTIPDSVTSVGDSAFYGCSGLTSIAIPDSVTSIGINAFNGCSGLTSVIISNSVTFLGPGAFFGCSSLTSVTIPDSITSIGDCTFQGCSSLTSVTIPDSVSIIGNKAFCNCSSLTSIIIPGNVTSIGDSAFEGCKGLTSVTIPDRVTSIGDSAFEYCEGLTSVTIPDSVTSIGDRAFYFCSKLTSLTLGSSVESIGSNAFAYCSITGILEIPASVSSIGVAAFSRITELDAIRVADGNVHYYSDASGVLLSKDPVQLVWVPSSLEGSYTIPTGVTEIPAACFYYCESLTEIIISDTVISIGNSAFSGCRGLTEITIPASVTSIGKEFISVLGISSVNKVTFLGAAPELDENAFRYNTLTVHYPNNLPGWDTAANQNYGGKSITWEAYIGKITLEGATMTLSNSLSMNFVVDMDLLPEGDYYAVITRTYADGSTDTVRCDLADWQDYKENSQDNENRKYFSYHGIAAKEMIDELTVEIFNADGTSASNVWKDSPRAYALRAIEDEEADKKDPEKLALYVDMLNYGAAAQTYFGYKTDDLANEGLSDAQKAYATGKVTTENKQKTPGSNYFGASLALFNEIRLNFVFDASVINTGMYAEATYTDHDNYPRTITIPGTDFLTEGKNGLMVSVTGMAVADYNQAVTCTVYNADKTVVIAATDSVGSYLGRALQVETHELFDMILKFCYSAYNAFH